MKIREIPSYLDEHAHQLTELRLKQNKERYEGTNKERPGTIVSEHLGLCSRAYYTEYIGIIAELIVRDILDKNPLVSEYTVSTFIKNAEFVSNDCDIRYIRNGIEKRISVKGVERSLVANKQAINSEESTSVVFVRLIGKDYYEIHKHSPEEIKTWEVNKTHTEYYIKRLNEII